MNTTVTNSFIDVSDHGLLLVKGPDAITFLQGQVTCDIDQLVISDNTSQTTLGAHCTHKGRMLFSFRACQLDQETVALYIVKDLIPPALAALKKYSVFSKVKLIDASDSHCIIGYLGDKASLLEPLFSELPDTTNEAIHNSGAVIIKISENRYECWLNRGTASSLTHPIESHTSSCWTTYNIQDGIGEVRPETVEEFIPQMLNYQVVASGISFKKGCYTGQEVVARMHYLGKLKRRLHRFCCPSSELLEPGTPLYSPGKKQNIGHVVMSAPSLNQQTSDTQDTSPQDTPSQDSLTQENCQQEILAVVTEEAVLADQVHSDDNCQQKLQLLPLPYAIPKE